MKTTEAEGKTRKCMIPRCRRPVVVISPGQAEIRLTGPEIDVLLIKASPEMNFCLHHAEQIGWPWPSEKPKSRKLLRS